MLAGRLRTVGMGYPTGKFFIVLPYIPSTILVYPRATEELLRNHRDFFLRLVFSESLIMYRARDRRGGRLLAPSAAAWWTQRRALHNVWTLLSILHERRFRLSIQSVNIA